MIYSTDTFVYESKQLHHLWAPSMPCVLYVKQFIFHQTLVVWQDSLGELSTRRSLQLAKTFSSFVRLLENLDKVSLWNIYACTLRQYYSSPSFSRLSTNKHNSYSGAHFAKLTPKPMSWLYSYGILTWVGKEFVLYQ